MKDLLTISDITKVYESERENVLGIEKVSFTVNEGEFISIIGPSGCGKSTLLRCIAGFERASYGKVILEGNSVTKPAPDRFMIFQGLDQLFPWMTLKENIIFAMKAVGQKRDEDQAKNYLELVDLSGFQDFYPYQLSGGMKQRASIARALSVKPKVLLMDEPFGSLDAFSRKAIHHMLLRVWEKTKITIIFVTHDVEEAIDLSDRILVFSPGKLKKDVPNPLPRPREKDTINYRNFFLQLSRLLDGEFNSSGEKELTPAEATLAF